MATLTVRFLDGETIVFDNPRGLGGTAGGLRQRLAERTGLSAASISLCCCGERLPDGHALGTLRSDTLTAWTTRWSAGRSEHAAALEEMRARAGRDRRREVPLRAWCALRDNAPEVVRWVRRVPRGVWIRAAVYTVRAEPTGRAMACALTPHRVAQALFGLARRAALAMPFTIASLIWLMIANLGERRAGDASAYTVFNRDFRALPGQLRAEDFQRELLHQ